MKIGVVTYYAVNNIGDKILTDVVSWKLKEKGHQVRIIDIQARHAYRFKSFVGKIEKYIINKFCQNDSDNEKYKYLFNAISQCDIIVFGGGQIITLYDKTIIKNIDMIINICKSLNKEVYFNAIGIATWGKTDSIKKIQQIFLMPNVKEISVRDDAKEFNKVLLENCAIRAKQVCDTAVWSCEANNIKRRERSKLRNVGLNIIYSDAFKLNNICDNKTILNIYSSIYKELETAGYIVSIFTNGVTKDFETAIQLCHILNIQTNQIRTSYKNGYDFLNYLNNFDAIISSRLHTSICSFSLKIPTLAIPWDKKINFFYKSIGFENCCLQIDDFNICFLREQLNNIMYMDLYDEFFDKYRNTIFSTDFWHI